MTTRGHMYRTTLIGAAVVALLVGATSVGAQAGPNGAAPDTAASVDRGASYWTPARRAAAQPRDLVIDERGLGYLKRADGTLEPYGHSVAAAPAKPQAGPPAPGDGAGPDITVLSPEYGGEIGADHEFQATVTDGDGVKSVEFVLNDGSTSTSYLASSATGNSDVYTYQVTGLAGGDWTWTIVARDNAKRGGNTSTKGPISFTVTGGSTGTTQPPPPTTQPPSAGPCDDPTAIVVNTSWSCGGEVQTAAGRIYFEMPANQSLKRWNGYVCSGTVVKDGLTGTSVILTAAHCVYDDVYKVFAQNVLFIPNQAGTTGTGTDRICDNDPFGCWKPSRGVVHRNWTTSTFPANIPWDYAYYVVPDTKAAHLGTETYTSLDGTVNALPVNFGTRADGRRTHALGYSYSDDPNFMYCAEGLTTEQTYSDYWLPNCGLSGGASGGPWIQPMNTTNGSGDIVSVNSWGYRGSPGMGGPPLTTKAKCVFDARDSDLTQVRGVVVTC